MIQGANIVVRISLLQVFVVMAGVFMTRAAFMMYGYPDAGLNWNAFSLSVSNYGFLMLLLPVAWTLAVVNLENTEWRGWSGRWTIGSGIFLLFVLAVVFFWSFTHPLRWL